MRNLPVQEQTLTGVYEYEFDVSALLSAGDTVASVVWSLPSQLNSAGEILDGTKVRIFIEADATAQLHDKYSVSFTVTSNGDPISVSPTLSFTIVMVKRLLVKVV